MLEVCQVARQKIGTFFFTSFSFSFFSVHSSPSPRSALGADLAGSGTIWSSGPLNTVTEFRTNTLPAVLFCTSKIFLALGLHNLMDE